MARPYITSTVKVALGDYLERMQSEYHVTREQQPNPTLRRMST